MRYILMLALGLTTVLSYAQSVNNPQPEITAVNPQPESVVSPSGENNMLGLPTVPIPVNNPQTSAKIELGDKLFHDKRFSVDGTVSCAKCHDDNQAFTDSLSVSVGHNGLTGTRNAPTVLNAAFNKTQFWDGREPDLEGQSKQPPINPVEGGLANYEPILEIVRKDSYYPAAFQSVFGVSSKKVTIDHIAKAIASFERTLVTGNSAFDRYYFKGRTDAMTDTQVDVMVLSDKKTSELGRFAVTDELSKISAFKTPTLRNVELTAPYMHDGSLQTLKDVVIH